MELITLKHQTHNIIDNIIKKIYYDRTISFIDKLLPSIKLPFGCELKIIDYISLIEDIKNKEQLINLIDNENTTVEYCEDGTIIRLYNYNDNWYTSTTKTINASVSYWSSSKSFHELFSELFDEKYLEILDKNSTYFFILLEVELGSQTRGGQLQLTPRSLSYKERRTTDPCPPSNDFQVYIVALVQQRRSFL